MSDRPGACLLLLPPGKVRKSYQGNDAFGILGVSPEATTAEIKRAYIQLARRYHPDVNPSTKEIFVRINQAYADIMSRRDLTDLMLKCEAVKAKAHYAEGLQVFKRAKLFAGVDLQVAGGAATGELGKQLQTLGMYLFFICPGCQWREKCDHATRFDEVEEIHRELMSKAMTAFWGGKDEKKQSKRGRKGKEVKVAKGQV